VLTGMILVARPQPPLKFQTMKYSYIFVPSNAWQAHAAPPQPAVLTMTYMDHWFDGPGPKPVIDNIFDAAASLAWRLNHQIDNIFTAPKPVPRFNVPPAPEPVAEPAPRFTPPAYAPIREEVPRKKTISQRKIKNLMIGGMIAASGLFIAARQVTAHFGTSRQQAEVERMNLPSQLVATHLASDKPFVPTVTPPGRFPYRYHHDHYDQQEQDDYNSYADNYAASHHTENYAESAEDFSSLKPRFDRVLRTDPKYAGLSGEEAFQQMKQELTSSESGIARMISPIKRYTLYTLTHEPKIITSVVGIRTVPSVGEYNYMHPSTDISASVHSEVVEAIEGGATVIRIVPNTGYYSIPKIKLITAQGIEETYSDINPDPNLHVGDHIDQGGTLGEIAYRNYMCAGPTGQHLDYNQKINGRLINSTHSLRDGYVTYGKADGLTAELGSKVTGRLLQAADYNAFLVRFNSPSSRYTGNGLIDDKFIADNIEFITVDLEGGAGPEMDSNHFKVSAGVNQESVPVINGRYAFKVDTISLPFAQHYLQKDYVDPATAGITDPALYMVVSQSAVLSPTKTKHILEKCGGNPYTFLKLQREYLEGLTAHKLDNIVDRERNTGMSAMEIQREREQAYKVQDQWSERLNRVGHRLETITGGAVSNTHKLDTHDRGKPKTDLVDLQTPTVTRQWQSNRPCEEAEHIVPKPSSVSTTQPSLKYSYNLV
jgi:hypothetical protein